MSNDHGDATSAEGTKQSLAGESGEMNDAMLTMDELMAQYEAAEPLQELREGDVVTGTVVQIDEQCAMIDVGTKSEGMIPKAELDEIRDQLAVGDQIQVCVHRIEDEEGNLIVSKRQADYERAWEDIVDKEKSGEVIEAEVVEAVKGGLLVDLGIYGQGFVPASHVSVRRPRNLGRYVGQHLRLQVIEVERKRKRVVLSHRKVVEDERAAERDDTIKTLREGQVRRGVVRRLTDFGAFVDIGGVDGLLHISEMSWNRIDDPGEMLRVNDEVEVMVLKLNLGEGRISLGLRQLLSDPWREVPKVYREGQVVRARINRLVADGLVVRLPVGLDSYVPVPEELRGADGQAVEAAESADQPAEPAEPAEPVTEPAEPVAEASEAVAPAEPVDTEAPVEVAEAAEVTAEAEAPAEVAAETEAAAEAEAAEPAFAVGAEVEVRIDRIVMVEREMMLSLASTQPPVERRAEAAEGGRPARAADQAKAPLARGRYSDRVRDEEEQERDARQRAAGRRDRRRDRDDDRERERDVREAPVPEQAPLARRTLGDLMGDKLRSLFQEEESDSGAAESEAAKEGTDESSN